MKMTDNVGVIDFKAEARDLERAAAPLKNLAAKARQSGVDSAILLI
jgi:hypothetical protein